jgi:hypothetical protein
MMRSFVLVALSVLLAACGSEPSKAPAAAVTPAPPPKPMDESRRFPQANLLGTEVVNDHLLGKAFMPGGTLAHYRKGKTQYDLFVTQLPTPTDAAIALLDWSKALTNADLIASFGGYAGQDAGRPIFVFSKGRWIAGVAGLRQKQADPVARVLAAHLD